MFQFLNGMFYQKKEEVKNKMKKQEIFSASTGRNRNETRNFISRTFTRSERFGGIRR